MRRYFLIIFLLLMWIGTGQTQFILYNHPELKWQTFRTEHFDIHFHQGTKNTALIVAQIAEEIFGPVTKTYNYVPAEKIHLIIKDVDDYSNGGAFFFDNKIEIWAANLDFVMRGTKNWLRDVVTHEFTHMISIQAMIKSNLTFPYGFFQVFGYEPERRKDVVRGFPNVLVSYPISSINIPVWFAEGIAQHQVDGHRYDYRDPHREMVTRDRILNNAFLTYNQMTVFGKTSHGNESAYNQGMAFVNYLTDRFGEGILEKITRTSAKWSSYTFEGVLEKVTGLPVDTLYKNWVDSLTTVYTERTRTIRANLVKGQAVEKEGFANLYPVWSPDGSKLAYISNKGSDYFGINELVVKDLESGEEETVSLAVTSSLSWSPDGRYLVYSRDLRNEYRSAYHDLHLYDFEKKKEVRITKNLRGANPDFSHDGRKILFVTSTNGLQQLNVLELDDQPDGEIDKKAWYDIETGELNVNGHDDITRYRQVEYEGKGIEQLLVFRDGRQIFHPRWSNSDEQIVFDTSIDYGRDIGRYDLKSGKFDLIVQGKEEYRYPVYQPESDYLYFAASLNGIYNIYRQDLKTGHREMLTNVAGGAMMPAVNKSGQLAYALYDSVGYKIYHIDRPQPIDPALAPYDPGYPASVPVKNFDNTVSLNPEIKPYKQTFPKLHLLPRLLIDYGTVKPGLYVVQNDLLDKYMLVGGFASNVDFDYDLYGYFEYRELQPTLFFEVFNTNATIADTLNIFQNETDYVTYKRDVTFNLTEARIGIFDRLIESPFDFTKVIDARANLVWRRYSAKIDQHSTYIPYNGTTEPGWTFRYDYLKGWAAEISLLAEATRTDRNKYINPRGGRYVFLKYSYESSDFIEDFAFDITGAREIYKTYNYNQFTLDWEEFFTSPISKNHGLGIRLRGGYIDRPVDSFFHLFAGGFIGMRGYSYFSIEGRQKLIGSVSYRFPLLQNIDGLLGHIYFDKLYMGLYYDYGNAWNGDLKWNDFKQDVGFQLRLNTFSNSLFPTRIFFEAVYPLNKITNRNVNVVYQQDWRYYFGVLFDFDIRERMNGLMQRLPIRFLHNK